MHNFLRGCNILLEKVQVDGIGAYHPDSLAILIQNYANGRIRAAGTDNSA